MRVLYVSFGSKVRPRTFGYVAMRSAVLFIFRSRLRYVKYYRLRSDISNETEKDGFPVTHIFVHQEKIRYNHEYQNTINNRQE